MEHHCPAVSHNGNCFGFWMDFAGGTVTTKRKDVSIYPYRYYFNIHLINELQTSLLPIKTGDKHFDLPKIRICITRQYDSPFSHRVLSNAL